MWVVLTDEGQVVSEHASAFDAACSIVSTGRRGTRRIARQTPNGRCYRLGPAAEKAELDAAEDFTSNQVPLDLGLGTATTRDLLAVDLGGVEPGADREEAA